MSTETLTKINRLLIAQPSGIVFLSEWLTGKGYSLDLQKRYRRNKWLESIGSGAMVRFGDTVDYEGAIYALQTQSGLSVHPGATTALGMLGKAHYLEIAQKRAIIFGSKRERLPAWFRNHTWNVTPDYYPSTFLPSEIGVTLLERKTFSIKVSGAARAMMECLYLAPEKQSLIECYELMEGLNNLRPSGVQELLENCRSVKVKRLFLFLAEKAGHRWLESIDLTKVDLGAGKRSIVKNGAYIDKYQITVPREIGG